MYSIRSNDATCDSKYTYPAFESIKARLLALKYYYLLLVENQTSNPILGGVVAGLVFIDVKARSSSSWVDERHVLDFEWMNKARNEWMWRYFESLTLLPYLFQRFCTKTCFESFRGEEIRGFLLLCHVQVVRNKIWKHQQQTFEARLGWCFLQHI